MIDRKASGLRESKKRRTRDAILANAIALFRRQGIRSTRTHEIARVSGVSSATLFNYFPTKAAIAEAWVRGEVDEALSTAAQVPGEHSLRSLLRRSCRRLARLVSDQPSLRLEAWRAAGRAPFSALAAGHPIVLALTSEQKRERIRGDLAPELLGEMLFDAVESGLIASLRSPCSDAEVAAALRARIDLVLDGARKRNERVAAPMAASTQAMRPAPST